MFVQVTNSGRKQGKSNFCVLKVMNKIPEMFFGISLAALRHPPFGIFLTAPRATREIPITQ